MTIVDSRRKCFLFLPIRFTVTRLVKNENYELVISKGLMSKKVEKIDLYKITDIAYARSFFDFINLRGTVEIHSTDTKTKRLFITKIRKHKQFAELIEEYMREERKRLKVNYNEVHVVK